MRKLIFTAIAVCLFGATKAQFSKNVGATVFIAKEDGGQSTTAWGVTFFPRYSFGALSVGAPISLGISGSTNSRVGASEGSSLTLHLPLVVDYNFGLGADPEDESTNFGFYAGAGYGLFSTSYVGVFSSGTLKANGPMARAGIRALIKEKVITLGATYIMGGAPEKATVIGIGATIQL